MVHWSLSSASFQRPSSGSAWGGSSRMPLGSSVLSCRSAPGTSCCRTVRGGRGGVSGECARAGKGYWLQTRCCTPQVCAGHNEAGLAAAHAVAPCSAFTWTRQAARSQAGSRAAPADPQPATASPSTQVAHLQRPALRVSSALAPSAPSCYTSERQLHASHGAKGAAATTSSTAVRAYWAGAAAYEQQWQALRAGGQQGVSGV
jgi:hypothetical protein